MNTGRSKGKLSTGNAQTDVLTVGEMAAHFHRMYRVFDAHHRADLSISDDGIRNGVRVEKHDFS